MLAEGRFIIALFIAQSFGNARVEVPFEAERGCLCLACLEFAVLCLENIIIVRLLSNRILIKFELEFVHLHFLIFNQFL